MSDRNPTDKKNLPTGFDDLVRQMAPHAICDDTDYDNAVDMVDRLMAWGRLVSSRQVMGLTL